MNKKFSNKAGAQKLAKGVDNEGLEFTCSKPAQTDPTCMHVVLDMDQDIHSP